MNELRRWAVAAVIVAAVLVSCRDDKTRSTTTEAATATADPTITTPTITTPTITTPTITTPTISTTPTITTPTAMTPPHDCSVAKIVRPVPEASVPAGSVVIQWEPPSCIVDVATYQYGALVEKRTGVNSGAAFELPPAMSLGVVRTELKIWRPGAPLPAHSVWVVVRA